MILEDLANNTGFRDGLVAGVVGLVAIGALALALRRPSDQSPLGLAGVAVVLATLFGLERLEALADDEQLLLGLLVLAAGALISSRLPWPLALGAIAALPGAALVASTSDVANIDIDWVRVLTFVTTAAGAALVADFDRHNGRAGLAPVLLAVTALGMYTTVPDTEQAAVLVGATLPLVLLGWPKPLASLGAPGAAATVGLVVWTASVGGRGRPGAIVGAMACLGVMLLEPIVRRGFRRRPPPEPTGPLSSGMVIMAALHVALVLCVSLAAGREVSARAAAAISVVAFAAAAVTLAVILMLQRPRARASGRA
ncbi:MAG: hypothetical protein ACRDY4_16745 [Acidimicrobiia bacterium]